MASESIFTITETSIHTTSEQLGALENNSTIWLIGEEDIRNHYVSFFQHLATTAETRMERQKGKYLYQRGSAGRLERDVVKTV